MIKNVLLVDTSVPDHEVFLQSVNESTKAIPYSATTTYDQIREAFPGPVDQAGIVFVKGALFLGQAFTDQYDFFQSLVQQFEIKHLDFLGCETLDEWKAFYERFTGVIIGASNNKTGNLQYGGDWVMESTAEDVESVYFTKSIEYYKYLLDTDPFNVFFTKTNGDLYGLGNNRSYNLGIATGGTFAVPTPIRINGNILQNIEKHLISSTQEFTWIGVGEKLYCAGVRAANYSGLNNSLFNYAQSTTFVEIPIHPTATGLITFVSTGHRSGAVVKGGKIYAQIGGTSFVPISFPAGVTGNIKAIETPESILSVMIENTDPSGGSLYAIGSNGVVYGTSQTLGAFSSAMLTPIQYQGIPIRGVTKFASHISGTLCLANGQMLYAGTTDTGRTVDFIPVAMPAGATGAIEHIVAGRQRINVVIGGVLYGMGYNNWNQLGTGPTAITTLSKIYTNYNSNPITGITDIRCANAGTYLTINNNLYGFGDNNSNQLGNNVGTNIGLLSTDVYAVGVPLAQLIVSGSSTFNSRNYGPNGVTFQIVGDFLSNIDYVQFGVNRVLKTSMTVTSTLVTFAVPSGSGTVIPVVTDSDGNTYTLAAFYYSNPMVLTGLSVSTGRERSILRLTSPDFSSIQVVKFGDISANNITRISSTEYLVNVPTKGSDNTVMVRVFDSYETASNGLSFTYVSLSINRITTEGGQPILTAACGSRVRIVGTNFTPGTEIYFGNSKAEPSPQDKTLVTIPNVLGEVTVRIFDDEKNMIEYPSKFVCTPAVTVDVVSPVVLNYSTLDASTGNRYFAGSDNKIRVILNGTSSLGNVYTHSSEIYGLAYATNPSNSKPTLFFGDRSTRRIYALDISTTPVLSVFYENHQMNPTAIKVISGFMYIACARGMLTDLSILKLTLSQPTNPLTLTYQTLSSYQLRGITADVTGIYVTAVPYNGEEYNLTQGRVIKLNSSVVIQTDTFITGVNNPKDLTFLNGYLVVDGAIQFYTPSGVPVTSFETDATSIISDGANAYFTSTTGITSTINLMTVEPYVEPIVSLGTASPLTGPKGTYVFVQGNLLTSGNTSVLVNGIAHTDYWVSSILLTIRMPFGVGEVPIQVTAGGVTKTFTYTYASPNIVTVIPLYLQDVKYYHFTGNSLRNILYIAFGDQTTTTITLANRVPVTNVTDTSFDCSFNSGIPVNSTRVLLMDAYGTVTYEDSNMFTLSSETCFLGGTPVLTDQGPVPIEKIDPTFHTLDHQEIRAITKIRYNGNALVLLEQDSLRRKYPTRDTVISRKHKIYYKGKMKTAESLVGRKGVRLVPYQNQFLYNVLLDTPGKMSVNGLLCETLHPKNPITRYFV